MREQFRQTLSELHCLLRLQQELQKSDTANRELLTLIEAKIIASTLLGQVENNSHEVTPTDVQTLASICREMRWLNLSIEKIQGILERELNTLRDLIVPSIPHLESLVQIRCCMVKENLTTDGEVLKKLVEYMTRMLEEPANRMNDVCWENEQRAATTADVGLIDPKVTSSGIS